VAFYLHGCSTANF
jgi:hypothetical protein